MDSSMQIHATMQYLLDDSYCRKDVAGVMTPVMRRIYRIAAEFLYRCCVGIEDCRPHFRDVPWGGACSNDADVPVHSASSAAYSVFFCWHIHHWLAGRVHPSVHLETQSLHYPVFWTASYAYFAPSPCLLGIQKVILHLYIAVYALRRLMS